MKAIEFDTYIKAGNNIEIPANHSNKFAENDHKRVIVLKEEDEAEDIAWANIAAKELFRTDDETNDIYEKLRN